MSGITSSNRRTDGYSRNYKLLAEAATVGHIGAKEQLALGHLMGVQMPMDFARARKYFEEGVATGSPASHYVRVHIF